MKLRAFVISMCLSFQVFGSEQALLTAPPIEGNRVPIASLTKMMTALIANESSKAEVITITKADIDTIKRTRSRLKPGMKLTRQELIQLMLVASENRAAFALARSHPGGYSAFIQAMNTRAGELGVNASFTDPAGLGATNQASFKGVYLLGEEFSSHGDLRAISVMPKVKVGNQVWQTTNTLVRKGEHPIAQKTGFTNEAGSCLYMKTDAGSIVILGSKNRWEQLKTLLAPLTPSVIAGPDPVESP